MARIVEAIGRWRSGALSCMEAAEVLGMSERHFRRLRDRYEAEGAEGLIDRRRGRVSGGRVPLDRIEWVLEQFRTRYFDLTVKHFHEQRVAEHGCALGYTLDQAGAAGRGLGAAGTEALGASQEAAAPALAGHAAVSGRRAPRLARGAVAPRPDRHHGRRHDRGLLGLPGRGGGHGLELCGPGRDDRPAWAVLCALHRSRQLLLVHAQRPAARWRSSRRPRSAGRWRGSGSSTFRRTVPRHAGAWSGCSERCSSACRRSCAWPRSARSTPPTASSPSASCRRTTPASRSPPPSRAVAFVPFAGDLAEVLCVQGERVVGNDNCVRYDGFCLQFPVQRHRHHFVKVKVRVRPDADGRLAVFHGPRCLARYHSDGTLLDELTTPCAA